jgi:torulene dioxygenase
VNAWEEQNIDTGTVTLLCELVEFPDAQILHRLQYRYIVSSDAVNSRGEEECSPETMLTRYRLENILLPNAGKAITSEASNEAKKVLSISAGDLPRINPNFAFKPHRYVYSMLNRGKSSFIDGIGKTDTILGTTTVWEEARHTPGEPIFVPRPGAREEDEGVILTVVFNGDSGTSYLLCLDARDLVEMGRAVASRPIGLGFHGLHVPAPRAPRL